MVNNIFESNVLYVFENSLVNFYFLVEGYMN